jgi:hypothetical protein
MSRKLSILGISILVLFIAIIIAAVYNYYIIDVIKLSRPSIDTEDKVETRVGMIYQTKIGGDEWFIESQ